MGVRLETSKFTLEVSNMAQSQPKGWQNILESLYGRYDSSQVYRDAVRMIACALSMQT